MSDVEKFIDAHNTQGVKESTTKLNKATERLASLLLEETARNIVEKGEENKIR